MVETWGQLVPALMPTATQPEPPPSPGNSGNTSCRLSPRRVGGCGKTACPQKAEDPRALKCIWRVGPGGAGLCSGGYWNAQLLLPTFRPYRFEGTGWLPISELRSARPGEYLVETTRGRLRWWTCATEVTTGRVAGARHRTAGWICRK